MFHVYFYMLENSASTSEYKRHLDRMLPSEYIELQGELRDALDVVNPVIICDINEENIIAHASTDERKAILKYYFIHNYVGHFNYVAIYETERYYFIEDMQLLRNNLISVSLHCDVLGSFCDFIYGQKAFIARNENTYNALLPDERRIVLNQSEIINMTITDIPDLNYYKFNVSFGTASQDMNEIYNIVALGHTTGVNRTYINSVTDLLINPTVGLPNVRHGNFAVVNAKTYVLNLNEIAQLLDYVSNNTPSTASSVSSIFAYPINFKSKFTTTEWDNMEDTFSLGASDIYIGHKAHNLKMLTTGCLLNTAFVLTDNPSDFNDLEPYCTYELYIPYYGFFKIDYNNLRGHSLYLYYVINFQTGSATVLLYDRTNESLVASLQCQIGIEIPKNTSNVTEVRNRHEANNMSMGMSLLSSTLAVVVGIISENPVAVAGGAITGAKAIGDYAKQEKSNIFATQINFNGSTSPLFAPQTAFIRKTRRKIQYTLTSDFLRNNGGVCNQLMELTQVTGYTEIADIPNVIYTSGVNCPTDKELDEIVMLLKNGVYFG